MTALGLAVSAIGQTWALVLGSAVLIGFLGNSAHFPPLVTYVSRWFDRRRGTAVALDLVGAIYRRRRLADGIRARHGRLRLAGDNVRLRRRDRSGDRAVGAVFAPAPAAGPDGRLGGPSAPPSPGACGCNQIWFRRCSARRRSCVACRWRCPRGISWRFAATSASRRRRGRRCCRCCSAAPSSAECSGGG